MGDNSNIYAGTQAAGADGTKLAWFSAIGSTAPTDSTTTLAAAWKDTGLISEDGFTAGNSTSSKDVKAYGSTSIQRTLVTDQKRTFKLAFLEANRFSMAVYHRLPISSITPSAGAFSVTEGVYSRQQYAMVLDTLDGGNHIRYYLPNVEVTDLDDSKFSNGEVVQWGITVTAYPNSSGIAVQKFFLVTNA